MCFQGFALAIFHKMTYTQSTLRKSWLDKRAYRKQSGHYQALPLSLFPPLSSLGKAGT